MMRSSRRQFLQAAAAGPALATLQPRSQTRVATIRDSSFDPRVEIDAGKLRHNASDFEALGRELQEAGVKLGRRHAASSFALFEHPDAFLDMVRPGMALYGIYSEARFRQMGVMNLQPAVSLKARVVYVKMLEAGDSAGYERAYRAERPVWVATLPVGHADGLPRSAAKGGRVRIGATTYPIVASVSASHSIIEVGSEPRVNIGDVATIFDDQDGSRPEDLAASCDSSVYDLTMHLHAELPRVVV
jgi:alanine racemase